VKVSEYAKLAFLLLLTVLSMADQSREPKTRHTGRRLAPPYPSMAPRHHHSSKNWQWRKAKNPPPISAMADI